jgi:hypothetical protein
MKLLSFHNQLVADLAPHHQQHYLRLFDIIQHPEVADTQFKFRERIGPQLLDGLCGRCRLMDKAGLDRGFQEPPLTR